jgi:hypothetical protein
MNSWKDNLDKTIDINAMLLQYEAMIKNQDRYIKDLENKLTVISKCALIGHSSIKEILSLESPTAEGILENLKNTEKQMSEVLRDGSLES